MTRLLDEYDFNPRSPHGERHAGTQEAIRQQNFNPRSPHGERRASQWKRILSSRISIHAPRTGSDLRDAIDKL